MASLSNDDPRKVICDQYFAVTVVIVCCIVAAAADAAAAVADAAAGSGPGLGEWKRAELCCLCVPHFKLRGTEKKGKVWRHVCCS